MNKIFISYSSKDQDWVRNWLLSQLESTGLHAHIDFRDFEIGQPSLVNMERALEECAKTLLVLTPHNAQSEFTNFEALFLADYHLEACRLCLAQHAAVEIPGVETSRRDVSTVAISTPIVSTTDHLSKARQHLADANEMIEKMGYGRRKLEMEALQREIEALKI